MCIRDRPQQVAGPVQVAHRQGGAHLRARNAVAVAVGDVGQGLHLEAMAQAGFAQQVDVAAALVAEAEILSLIHI